MVERQQKKTKTKKRWTLSDGQWDYTFVSDSVAMKLHKIIHFRHNENFNISIDSDEKFEMKESNVRATGYRLIYVENLKDFTPRIHNQTGSCLGKTCVKVFAIEKLQVYYVKAIRSNRSRRVVQLVSALPSVLEVPSSILSDSNVCSDFSLICVAVALNTRKMEHWQREGVKGAPSASIDNSSMNWRNYRR